MEINAVAMPIRTFDFEREPVQTMDLHTLRQTAVETNDGGKPFLGIFHYELIEKAALMCRNHQLDCEIEEIFAAKNQNKFQPGITLLPELEQKYGERAVQAHILRRVFTTIRVKNYETDELTTTVVIVYHQDGIQVAVGPCVRVCHNQCILGSERLMATYGKGKLTLEELLARLDEWLGEFEQGRNADISLIERLKSRTLSHQEIFTYIGMLTGMRVAHDSKNKALSAQVETYPLNQSQISQFTENILVRMKLQSTITAWDLYNDANVLYKPETRADFTTLLPQNAALATHLLDFAK